MHTAHCTLHTAHFTLHTVHYTLHIAASSLAGSPPEALPEARQQGREGTGGGEGSPPHPPADSHSCPAPGCVSKLE